MVRAAQLLFSQQKKKIAFWELRITNILLDLICIDILKDAIIS